MATTESFNFHPGTPAQGYTADELRLMTDVASPDRVTPRDMVDPVAGDPELFEPNNSDERDAYLEASAGFMHDNRNSGIMTPETLAREADAAGRRAVRTTRLGVEEIMLQDRQSGRGGEADRVWAQAYAREHVTLDGFVPVQNVEDESRKAGDKAAAAYTAARAAEDETYAADIKKLRQPRADMADLTTAFTGARRGHEEGEEPVITQPMPPQTTPPATSRRSRSSGRPATSNNGSNNHPGGPTDGEADNGHEAARELPSVERLARAMQAADGGVRLWGKRGFKKVMQELADAQAELDGAIDGFEFGSEAEQKIFKAMMQDLAADRQIELSDAPKGWHETMAKIGNWPILRLIRDHKVKVYGAVLVITIAGAVITVATAGVAAAPAVVGAILAGAGKAAVPGAVIAGSAGGVGARIRRLRENAKDFITGHKNDQQSRYSATDDNETYSQYAARLNGVVYNDARNRYRGNQRNRLQTIGKAALQGGAAAAVTGGFLGMAHAAAGLHGVEHAATPLPTPEQVHDAVKHVIATDPNRIGEFTNGQYHFTHQAVNHHDPTVWAANQNHAVAGHHLSNVANYHDMTRGATNMHGHGFTFHEWNADFNHGHFQPHGNTWGFGKVEAHHTFIIDPQGGIHGGPEGYHGILNNAQTADALHYASMKGSVILQGQDQLATYLTQHAHIVGGTVPGPDVISSTSQAVGNGVGTLEAVAAGVVAGTVSGSAAALRDIPRRPTNAPRFTPNNRRPAARPASAPTPNPGLTPFDPGEAIDITGPEMLPVREIVAHYVDDFSRRDESIPEAERYEDALRQVAVADRDAIGALSPSQANALVQQFIAATAGLDEGLIRDILGV